MGQGFAHGTYRNILRFLKEDVCWKSCSSDFLKLFAMMLVVFTRLAQNVWSFSRVHKTCSVGLSYCCFPVVFLRLTCSIAQNNGFLNRTLCVLSVLREVSDANFVFIRSVAQHIVSGPLTELTGLDVEVKYNLQRTFCRHITFLY